MKNLTVFRHGIYNAKHELTDKSAQAISLQVQNLLCLRGKIDAIYTSDVLRALQTAEVIKSASGFEGELIITPALADYNASKAQMLMFFYQFAAETEALFNERLSHVVWVTHEPNIYALFKRSIDMGQCLTYSAESFDKILSAL